MKFKQMTIVCNDIEKLKKIYFDKCVNVEYVVNITDEENICEVAKNELEIMQISDTVILSVNESYSVEDMLEELKVNGLNAIVLENSATTYDKKYIGFKALEELIDFVINENKKFKFISDTANELSTNWNEKTSSLYTKLHEVSDDGYMLTIEAQEMFFQGKYKL